MSKASDWPISWDKTVSTDRQEFSSTENENYTKGEAQSERIKARWILNSNCKSGELRDFSHLQTLEKSCMKIFKLLQKF